MKDFEPGRLVNVKSQRDKLSKLYFDCMYKGTVYYYIDHIISNINHFTVVLYHQPFCIWEVWKDIKESRVAILYPLSLITLSTTSPEWRVGLEEIDDHKDMDLISQISKSLFVVGFFFVFLRPSLYFDLFPPISSQSLQTLERRFPNNFKHS